MRPDAIPIQTLLLRVFLPAVAIVAIALGLLTYNRLYDAIVAGFDRKLIAASALTGALVDARDHDALIAIARKGPGHEAVEAEPEYLRAARPMRRIRDGLDITYLYTQILGGPEDVVYVLDATVGPNHSTIGSQDDLPAEALAGVKRVQSDNGVHLSPIEFQRQWGLLKTAAAPVRDANGVIVATAGADVNVSLIRVATQNALFASVVVGMLSLFACAILTVLIVRRIARPLDRLRQEALRIAGGDHDPITPFPAPRDIARLQRALSTNSAMLTQQLAQARSIAATSATDAGLAALDGDLARIAAAPSLIFEGAAKDGDAMLRHAAAARLAERVATDPALADRIERAGPLLVLAPGERATALLGDGRRLLIGAGA